MHGVPLSSAATEHFRLATRLQTGVTGTLRDLYSLPLARRENRQGQHVDLRSVPSTQELQELEDLEGGYFLHGLPHI